MSEQKLGKKAKRATGSMRARAGLVAQAGRRRPKHIVSFRDMWGKRQWRTA